jgi:hypothetical protein
MAPSLKSFKKVFQGLPFRVTEHAIRWHLESGYFGLFCARRNALTHAPSDLDDSGPIKDGKSNGAVASKTILVQAIEAFCFGWLPYWSTIQ